ncbi:MAG: hypothetical protein J6D29_08900 [Solobacterium sp.]|nr:hypothetical protein [Solobacterium sp.]
MNLLTMVMVMLVVYTVFNVLVLSKQRQKGNEISNLLDVFQEEDTFFSKASELIEKETTPGTKEKIRVLKLWGEAYYGKEDAFKQTLNDLDVTNMFMKAKNPIEAYEDAFFYLCMAIPNRLYSDGKMALLDLLENKMDVYKETLENTLVYRIGKENSKFYHRQDDFGKGFLESVIEGEYAGFTYSKQLIGIYKDVVSTVLAAIYKEEGNKAKLEEQYPFLERFQQSALGERMLKELKIELPKKEEESSEEKGEEKE